MYGYTRQGYNKHKKILERDAARDREIVRLVEEFRREQETTGYRMIIKMLEKQNDPNLKIGRDKLIELLRMNNLLLRPPKRYVVTTNWKHKLKIYPNLLPEISILQKGQVLQVYSLS